MADNIFERCTSGEGRGHVNSFMPNGAQIRDAGFTLLEMIVVLVILGLMVGLIIARGPQRSPTLDLRAAAGEISQGLRGTRGQAVATGKRVVFDVDVAAHAFSIGGAAPVRLPASLGLTVVAVSDQVAAGRLAGISFAPDGSSSGGTIELVAGDHRARIEVDWLSGRITVDYAPAASQ